MEYNPFLEYDIFDDNYNALVNGNAKEPYCETELDSRYIMQYTGIKDNNNKDVYEGDIVFHKRIRLSPDEPLFSISEVYWDEVHGGFALRNHKTSDQQFTLDSLECEIIGNKFEHPELLEKK